jgi:galactoside O-acetyltransferase
MNSYYSESALKKLGFKSIGKNVLISKKSSFYGISRIQIGNNVRIDDFCFFSAGEGGICLGNYIHISPFCSLVGKGQITMDDFSGLSSRVSIYSSSDDYSGKFLTNPTVPDKFKNVNHADVHLQKHVIVGAGSIILPGVVIGACSAIGALSLVSKSVGEHLIAIGRPLKVIKKRKKSLEDLEWKFLNEL